MAAIKGKKHAKPARASSQRATVRTPLRSNKAKPSLRSKVVSRPVLKVKPSTASVKITPPAPKTITTAIAKPSSRSKATAKLVEPLIAPDKDISSKNAKGVVKDRIFLMVPDPHWLHVHWELSFQSVQRAEAALGQDWYGAKPCIRLFDVTSQDTTSTAESSIRDIPIHGGCSHWYIDIPQPPRTYRADIGYITRRGHFHPLCRSNVVTPPVAGSAEGLDPTWPKKDEDKAAERMLAMTNGHDAAHSPTQMRDFLVEKRNGKDTDAIVPEKLRKFAFDINAELIVYGTTDPSATVKLQNEPLKVRPDGSFTMRYSLTDGRQIIPAVATSSDGMEERTIVLAIERNTKHLDPQIHDLYAGE
jgi:hypothetical protein